MEIKTQIIVAVFTSIAGVLLGVAMVVFAVCYRRRHSKANIEHVNCRKHHLHGEADDCVRMNFGQRQNRNSTYYSASRTERISEQNKQINLHEIELSPKLQTENRNKRMHRKELYRSDKSADSYSENTKGNYDFSKCRKDSFKMHIPYRHTWTDEAGKKLKSPDTERHSYNVGMHNIPRPIVRPYKNELYKDHNEYV